ncbi:NAD(P)H-binding protein [Pseudomonas sp. C1C7]|uniref:NAD(P)-dependent oxidoreductase n=1 Tax=Pseudomonas sp. C1C7 TaxID=2735272 RepID=UPI00158660BB|nr:NAD(P)H-binding protein [Pseudomonas sp. C1C7]NUT77617.1 NAD(P)H-binding protein [Pseudomonas sp. C1C7]
MKVVVLAATGKAGRATVSELLSRGHEVTAVARSPEKLPSSVTSIADDLSSADKLASIIKGADAVVSAFGPSTDDPRYFSDVSYTDQLVSVTERVIEAVSKTGVPRLIVVGGAGSLWLSPGVTVLNSGHWPEQYVPIATSHVKAFAALKASSINWTYFSPPMMIAPGIRTGKFRLGGDDVVFDDKGKNWISFEDYAVALVNELEKPEHEYGRFTIGY